MSEDDGLGEPGTNEETLRLAIGVTHVVEKEFAHWAGPEVGSELHLDDQIWPWQPPSEVARWTLLAGIAHLKSALTLLHAGFEGPPIAYNSMLRGALLASCQTLWVVGADDPLTRQARALRLVAEEYRHRIGFHKSQMQSTDPGRAEHSKPWSAKWTHRLEELEAVRAGVPPVDDTTATKVIKRVAAEAFGEHEDGEAHLVGAWQALSSSVHGFSWGFFVRPGMVAVDDPRCSPLTAFKSELDLDDAVDTFTLCARLIAQAGKHLLERSEAKPRGG